METFIEISIGAYLSAGQFSFISLVMVYFAGLLTSTTPCVYPMIPITVGVFSLETRHQAGSKSTGGKFFGPLIYVAGLALVYGSLGIFAAATGKMFGEISTSPLGYILIANLCFIFALSMMGYLKIPLWYPGQQWLRKLTNPYLRLFFIGAASGLVAAPCTAPVLGMLLMYIATTGDLVYGGVLMVIFAYGLGSLLLLFAFSSQWFSRLPKSGRWLNISKIFMALLMVLTGEYFLTEAGKLLF
ncbi:cytochrome c biogenesis protein CcdA [Thalassomonas actiniarum]|uniref:Sulfite exporter TauE/SafE family protein n=1 Tax=Thalassomonas actiniarum TaxID=485447 RepID=A0AAF0C2K8_9GAMM|nr:cytochrome c biogenesis protein CcdA [Thalassomonas actiniarum]WDD98033.1 sulfite exporter TauE/SafE family protein [Thalassomonas actiniarum]